MNKWKIAFCICFVLLIFVSLYSIYAIVDQGVTLTYQSESYIKTDNDLDQIIELINKTSLSKKEIVRILQNHRWSEYMNFDSDTIALERVVLVFENDILKQISKQW